MRLRVFMQGLTLATALITGTAAAQEAVGELTALDVAALLDAGLPGDEVVSLAGRQGIAVRWNATVASGLRARGLTDAQLDRLARAASRAVPLSAFDVVFDGATGVTWAAPPGWEIGERDGELVITLTERAVSVTAEIRARALPVDAAELRGRGVATLNEYHALRVKEVLAGEGADWTHHGTWTLPAVGWTGVHAVFEGVSGTTRLTTCLTWFARGGRLLSISTRIEEPIGNPTHDAIVDDVTAILTAHAPRAMSAADLARLDLEARRERLVIADGDGAVVSLDRRRGATAPLLPPGNDRVGAASAGFLVTARGGLVEHHRLVHGEWSEPTPLHRVDGPVLAIAADPLGDGFSVLTRTVQGTLVRRGLDMRGEPREIATRAAAARLTEDGVTIGDVAVRMPGATETRTEIAGDDLLVAVTRLAEEKPEVVLLARTRDGLHELARMPTAADDETALTTLRGAAGETYVVAPGVGLCSMPREGGLPVRLIAPGNVRDVCLLP